MYTWTHTHAHTHAHTHTHTHTHTAPLTSNSARSEQVHDVDVVSKVTEDLQLGHQRLLLRGVGVG